ncbi:MAG: HAD family hydrolase, partial [Solirubrobacteraceae bacterium]
MGSEGERPTVAILDVDGTLVDTNYHHTIAWFRAFCRHGIVLPLWRIHRHIGMGGDQVVAALTDERTDQERGDDIRASESELYFELIQEVQPMEGSRELIEHLRHRGHTVVLASSAKEAEIDHYLDLLDGRELADAWTTSADVESTKPAPDLVHAALERVDGSAANAVMIGDTPWDVHAAGKAG